MKTLSLQSFIGARLRSSTVVVTALGGDIENILDDDARLKTISLHNRQT